MRATPRDSQAGRPAVRARTRRPLRAQAEALRRQGADIVVAVTHTDRADGLAQIVRSRAVDVLLTGHDHDLAIDYDGQTVMRGVERGRLLRLGDRLRRFDRRARARTARCPGRRASASTIR